MEKFTAYIPTKLHFGKDVIYNLSNVASTYGKKALLVYGKNSIKANGIYQQVTQQLDKAGVEFVEYHGIKSNPIVEDVDAAAELGKMHNVDMIIAVGGGSVIDSAKIISIAISVSHKAWDFVGGNAKAKTAIPILAVLTLAATGTEMNPFAVVQNHETGQKFGYGNPLVFPKHSFLDPSYTISVPADYTAYGIADLIAHCFEAYFGKGDSPLSDRIITSIIKEGMDAGSKLMLDLNNYDLRARVMFAATMALNGMTTWGKVSGDWGVHSIGHSLSLLYDVPHGASLSIAYPAWFKLIKQRNPEKIALLFKELFNEDNIDKGIEKLEDFFKSINCPVRLSEINIDKSIKKNEIFNALKVGMAGGSVYELSENDYNLLIELM